MDADKQTNRARIDYLTSKCCIYEGLKLFSENLHLIWCNPVQLFDAYSNFHGPREGGELFVSVY